MKTLTLLIALACSSSAFAKEVTDAKARALMIALEEIGAKHAVAHATTHVEVADVRCGSALTGMGKFGTCEMDDKVAGKVLRASDRDEPQEKRKVQALNEALIDAGAKVIVRAGGSSIDAKSVICNSSPFPRPRIRCVLTK